jgi:hypothetical protein
MAVQPERTRKERKESMAQSSWQRGDAEKLRNLASDRLAREQGLLAECSAAELATLEQEDFVLPSGGVITQACLK